MGKGNRTQPTPWSERAVLIWTSREVRAEVRRMAEAEQCSVAAIGRRALTQFLDQHARTEEPTTMPTTTVQPEKPTPEEIRWRIISDLLDWDASRSKAKLERLADEELRALWYGHRDAEHQRADAEEEQAPREAAEPEAGGA